MGDIFSSMSIYPDPLKKTEGKEEENQNDSDSIFSSEPPSPQNAKMTN